MSRTVLKTVTYGVMHLTVAIIVAYALTRNWTIALAVGVVEPVIQTVAFAIHERLWARTEAGAAPAAPACGHAHLMGGTRPRAGVV